jgi:hypothetical protein
VFLFFCQGLILPASNNVIWSLATGDSHEHDDPWTTKMTGLVTQHFDNLTPNNMRMVLMSNSLTITKLFKFLGLRSILSTEKPIRDMIETTVNGSFADDKGNYIERGLALMEKEESQGNVAMNQTVGRGHLREQLFDLVIGGKRYSTRYTGNAGIVYLPYYYYYYYFDSLVILGLCYNFI